MNAFFQKSVVCFFCNYHWWFFRAFTISATKTLSNALDSIINQNLLLSHHLYSRMSEEKKASLDILTSYLDKNGGEYTVNTSPTEEKIQEIKDAIAQKEQLVKVAVTAYLALVVGKK